LGGHFGKIEQPQHDRGERVMAQTAAGNVVINPDGSRTEFFEVPTDPATLEHLMREIFEQHWDGITAGPILQGAAYELMYSKPPKVTLSAGYLTVDTGEYHFHLYIGVPEGTSGSTSDPESARQRKISRAVFFSETREGGKGCLPGSWGFRMWNGVGEQLITIYFPNPYYDKQGMLKEPQLDRLQLWERMRDQYASTVQHSNP
jgi:hypothetical protein